MRLLVKLRRYLSASRHRSPVATGILPLKDIHSVVVFVDGADAGLEPLKIRIQKFVQGCSVKFVSARDKDLRTSSDAFIAINSTPSVDERYAAVWSTARFKVGRHQLPHQVYDLVVSDPGEEPAPVGTAFEVMSNLITQIK